MAPTSRGRHQLTGDRESCGSDNEMPLAELIRPVFSSERKPIRASLLPVLRELYEERLDRLEDYLQEDMSSWRCWNR